MLEKETDGTGLSLIQKEDCSSAISLFREAELAFSQLSLSFFS